MKIKFTKLPTIGGKIQVSLDGGQSFTDYNIGDIHDSGIPLDDNQDYEKNQIQGPANLLKNLNVVKQIKLEGSDGSSSGAGLSIKKTYWGWANDATGPATCYTDGSSRGAKVYRYENGQMIDTGRTVIGMGGGGTTGLMISDSGSVGYMKSNRQHYSNLDVTVEVESITEIQEAPTFTENGTFTAEEGKAFKSAIVDVPSTKTQEPRLIVGIDRSDRTHHAVVYFNRSFLRSLMEKNRRSGDVAVVRVLVNDTEAEAIGNCGGNTDDSDDWFLWTSYFGGYSKELNYIRIVAYGPYGGSPILDVAYDECDLTGDDAINYNYEPPVKNTETTEN